MDCVVVGQNIKKLRKEKGFTQSEIAQIMNISDKTVSKWECGLGCPDVNLLGELAQILSCNIDNLIVGEIENSPQNSGNLKNLKFYICKKCGNIITSFCKMEVNCCGRNIDFSEPKKAEENEKLNLELIENELFVSSDRIMTKNNFVMFVAYLVSDKVLISKQYPEWNLETRFCNMGHGKLVWGTNKGDLYYQTL